MPTLAAGSHGLATGPFALESGTDVVCRLVGRLREVITWSNMSCHAPVAKPLKDTPETLHPSASSGARQKLL